MRKFLKSLQSCYYEIVKVCRAKRSTGHSSRSTNLRKLVDLTSSIPQFLKKRCHETDTKDNLTLVSFHRSVFQYIWKYTLQTHTSEDLVSPQASTLHGISEPCLNKLGILVSAARLVLSVNCWRNLWRDGNNNKSGCVCEREGICLW